MFTQQTIYGLITASVVVIAILLVGISSALGGATNVIEVLPTGGNMVKITRADWKGNAFRFQIPEYVIPTEDRGKIEVREPEINAKEGWIRLAGKALSPYPADYSFTLRVGDDVVDMEGQIKNMSTNQWNAMAQCILCLRCVDAPDFFDADRGRTFIHTGGKFMAAKETKSQKPHFSHILRPEDLSLVLETVKERYYRDSEPADCSLIVRSSKDDKRHVGLAWEDACTVAYNLGPRLNCIHSEPRFGELKPGESRTIKGKIYFFTGTRDQLYERFKKDFPALGYAGHPKTAL